MFRFINEKLEETLPRIGYWELQKIGQLECKRERRFWSERAEQERLQSLMVKTTREEMAIEREKKERF